MQDTVNCPILVGHLNSLLKRGGSHAELAKQLVMILDDVEGIAELLDHQYPAERHAMSRASHIAESASRLQTIVVSLGTLSAIERDNALKAEPVKVTFKPTMNDGWFMQFVEDDVAKVNPMRFVEIQGTNLAVRFDGGDFRYYRFDKRHDSALRVQYGVYHAELTAFMTNVRANQKPLDVSAGPNWDKRHDQPVLE